MSTTNSAFLALATGAATVGALHSLAPDHWVPFAALARARRWSAWKTARITALCGLGHVTVSAALGLLALWLGLSTLQLFGERLEAVAGILLIAFGVLYGAWGLKQAMSERLHHHAHVDPEKTSVLTLFLLFSADPCVAVMPLLFAAAPLGAMRAGAVVVTYELSTLGAMIGLVMLANAGAQRLRAHWLDHYGDASAGGVIAATGVAVLLLGW
jgi:nickel/cobalt transporter (NicO) family protein